MISEGRLQVWTLPRMTSVLMAIHRTPYLDVICNGRPRLSQKQHPPASAGVPRSNLALLVSSQQVITGDYITPSACKDAPRDSVSLALLAIRMSAVFDIRNTLLTLGKS